MLASVEKRLTTAKVWRYQPKTCLAISKRMAVKTEPANAARRSSPARRGVAVDQVEERHREGERHQLGQRLPQSAHEEPETGHSRDEVAPPGIQHLQAGGEHGVADDQRQREQDHHPVPQLAQQVPGDEMPRPRTSGRVVHQRQSGADGGEQPGSEPDEERDGVEGDGGPRPGEPKQPLLDHGKGPRAVGRGGGTRR